MGFSPTNKFFVSGGTMPLDSASYVERSSDVALYESLLSGRYCYVLNARQMGKSSLSVRVIAKLDRAGVRTALVDLTRIGGRNVTPVQWYAGLCDSIGMSLNLRAEMLDYYRHHTILSPLQRFFGALENVALARTSGPIAVFVDEIDTTRNLSFEADEFFAGIRECFNRRAQNPEFNRLTFCLIGVAVPTDLISNPVTTPFNIGDRIQLNDFTLQEMQSLAAPLGPNGSKLIERIHYWTGGQPFLSQSLCEAALADSKVQTPLDVDALVEARLLEPRARSTNINLSDVGERILNAGMNDADPDRFRAELLTAYERALRGERVPDDEANRVAVVLKLSGLMRSDGSRLEVRNRIYREVFDRKWVEDNIPERELLRERQAFRRGIARAASASALVVASVCALGLLAWSSERRAASAGRALNYELYVADMNNMRLLEEIGDISQMDNILDHTRKSPYRGFEWNFWLNRIHDSKEEYTLDYSAPGKREFGFVSQDGKQICVYDLLAGVAAVIDRQTGKTLSWRVVGRQARVVATSAGFVTIESERGQIWTTDIGSGKVLSKLEVGDREAGPPVTRTRCDFALISLKDSGDGSSKDLVLWDMVTGKSRFALHSSRPIPTIQPAQFSFNQAGNRLLYGCEPVPGPHPRGLDWHVVDTELNRTIDSFHIDPGKTFGDFSLSGHLVLFTDADHGTDVRNVDQHAEIFHRQWDGGDIPVSAMCTMDDAGIAECFGNGRATLMNLADGQVTPLGQHIWYISTTDRKESLLASSTSIRIIGAQGDRSATTIGIGPRTARDDQGGISVFQLHPKSIVHYTDPDFSFVSKPDVQPKLRDYTYNGRWRLVTAPVGGDALFSDGDGKSVPLRITAPIANFSCGDTPESLVVLLKGRRRLQGLSGTSGKIRWTIEVEGEPITGLWVSPDGSTVLALSGDVKLLALDAKSGSQLATLSGHNVRIAQVAFTRDRKGMFTCGADGRAILWDLKTLKEVQQFRGNVAQRMSWADLSPDGKRVATCNFTGSWQLWDASTGIELMDIHGSPLPLRSILFSSDGNSVITAGDDQQIRRWSAKSEDPSKRIHVSNQVLRDIAQ